MDYETDAFEFMLEESERIEKDLSGGASENEIVRRLRGMTDTRFKWTNDIESYIRRAIGNMTEELLADGKIMPHSIVVNMPVTINTITDSPNATINPAPIAETPETPETPQKEPAKEIYRVINWRRIEDPRLNFNDRIIFSILWSWAYKNGKKRKHKPLTNYRIKKATGFRLSVIAKSVAKLQALKYINDKHETLITKHEKQYTLNNGAILKKGYTKVVWRTTEDERHDIKQIVAQAVIAQIGKKVRAGWIIKALGVSRRTAYTYLATGYGLH